MQINSMLFHTNNLHLFVKNNSKTSFGEKKYNEEETNELSKLWHNKRKNDFWEQVKNI